MKRPLLWAALLLTLGVLIMNSRAETRERFLLKKPSVRTALERSSSGIFPLNVRGTIVWAEEKNGRTVIRLDAGSQYGTVLAYPDEEHPLTREECITAVGSECIVSGTAFLFQEAENPGQFDVRGYYDSLGIYFGISKAEIILRNVPRTSFRRLCFRISDAFRRAVQENVSPEDAAFLLSLSTGEASSFTEDLRAETDALSALQLLSLSGFVISSLGMLIYRLLRRLTRNLAAAAFIPVLCMGFYFLILGSPVSFLRALLVFFFRVTAPALKRRFDTLSAAALSLLLLGLTRPAWLLLPAVQYYLAVLVSQGVICSSFRRCALKRPVPAEMLLSFFSIQACLLPVQILSRSRFSPYGNLLVFFLLPLRTGALILTLLGGFLGASCGPWADGAVKVLLFLPAKLRLLYEAVFTSFRALPASSVNAGRPPLWRVLIYLAMLLLVPAGLWLRSLSHRRRGTGQDLRPPVWILYGTPAAFAFILCFGMLFLRAPSLKQGEMVYTMLSVGQGDSGILRTPDLTAGVDCGSASLENAGEIFSDALSFYGARRLDVLLLTHGDLDHVNGLPDILGDPVCTPKEVWIPDTLHAEEEFREQLILLQEASVPVRKVGAGDRMLLGGTKLEILYPAHGADMEGNDASLVLLASYGGRSVLFTGDISMEAEEKILLPENGADILKVAHHGSRFSSGESFIRSVSPALSLVSYGRNNRYGHPSEEACARFLSAGIPLYGTGEQGAIEVWAGKDALALRFYGSEK